MSEPTPTPTPTPISDFVAVEDRDGVRWLRLQRPQAKNALNVEMYEALTAAIEGADADGQLRALVITGSEGVFTAGNDLKDFQGNPPMPGKDHPIKSFLAAVARFEKPLVVGVDGVAIGIGVTLLPHADLVLITDRARFKAPFVNLGLVPEFGSSYLLPLLCGHRKASEIFMLGDFFDAQTALECRLANQIVAPEALMERLEALASRLAAQPIGALIATKRLMKAPTRALIEATVEEEGEQFMARLQSPEAMEAMMAFFQKRAPNFRQLSS